jgi:hypothetical protein
MGIPEEMHPDKIFAKPPEPEDRPELPPDDLSDLEEPGAPEEPEEDQAAKAAAEAALASDPREVLKRLGIELTDEDVNRLLFKGYIEKPIKLCYDPLTKKPYVATFKTLTAQEYDEVDELLSEEMDNLKMTVNGRDARRSTWVLAFAMTHINGMILQKPEMKKVGKVEMIDTKATAEKRIKTIRALAPMILDKASRVYAAFTATISLILEDPEHNLIKKP